MRKTAIVLFNLGGPDSLAAVRPFLFNLFNDPAIIGVPAPIRWLLAQFISRRRAPAARAIYREMGGASPLVPNTRAQALALEAELTRRGKGTEESKVFIAMRYWRPRASETALAVRAYGPDRIVLLPLYPQYSSTTTGSSLGDWHGAAARAGLTVPSTAICCYPRLPGFIDALAARIAPRLAAARAKGPVRLLLTAHGLPKRIVAGGDPYRWQVEQTAAALVARLGDPDLGWAGLDWRLCYQSRVGPLDWIGPATAAQIAAAGQAGRALVVAPIAFVSEHSETLVELDIDYARLARKSGVLAYERVATVDTGTGFIAALADLVRTAAGETGTVLRSASDGRVCPAECGKCPLPAL